MLDGETVIVMPSDAWRRCQGMHALHTSSPFSPPTRHKSVIAPCYLQLDSGMLPGATHKRAVPEEDAARAANGRSTSCSISLSTSLRPAARFRACVSRQSKGNSGVTLARALPCQETRGACWLVLFVSLEWAFTGAWAGAASRSST